MRHGTLARPFLFLASLLAAASFLGMSGCAICCAPFDCDFGYTGGAWVRDNPSSGRVGSAFEPAGYKVLVEEDQAAEAEEPAVQNVDPENPGPDTVEPMPNAEPMPRPEPAPGTISTPRLRPVRNYLPSN